MKKVLALILALTMILSLCACGASTETKTEAPKAEASKTEEAPKADDTVYTIKLATSNAESSPITVTMKELAASLEEKSGGRLKMEVFPGGVLGGDDDLIEQALAGANIMIITDGSRMSNYVPDMATIMMPFFLDNWQEAKEVEKTDLYQKWVGELKDNGAHIFSYNWYSGGRYIFGDRAATNPAEFSGMRVRTGSGDAYFETIKALGASPVNMAASEVYSALSTAALDGADFTSTYALNNRIFEVADYCVVTEHLQLVCFMMVGEKWFNQLPADLQQILTEEIAAFGDVSSTRMETADKESLAQLEANGMEMIEVDKQIFVDASVQAYENLGVGEFRNEIFAQMGK